MVALKGRCSSKVLNLLLSDPSGALEISGDGQSTLFLALINNAEDQIVKRLMEIAPEVRIHRLLLENGPFSCYSHTYFCARLISTKPI